MSDNDAAKQSKFDQLIEQIRKSLTDVNASKATATQAVAEVNKAKGETQSALQGTKFNCYSKVVMYPVKERS